MPMYWADYRITTHHLTMSQHGAYLLLIAQNWVRGFLPGNLEDCCRIANTDTEQDRQDVAKVLAEFFELIDGNYVNTRVLEEIAKVKVRSEKQKTNVQKRWNKESDSNVVRMTVKRETPDDIPF